MGMRNVVLLASLLLSGCCGAYDGGGDHVYARNGSEMLILCGNGGFVANLTSSTIEGRYMTVSGDGGTAINGPDGELAFDVLQNMDGTATTPQLGDTPWTLMSLDQADLDHADVMCTDLESRPWWTAP